MFINRRKGSERQTNFVAETKIWIMNADDVLSSFFEDILQNSHGGQKIQELQKSCQQLLN
jgi:hypothetical protein